VRPQRSEDEIQRRGAEVPAWFRSSERGRGLGQTTALRPSLSGIFLIRLERVERVVVAAWD
jgi:hypothetical protein